MADFIVEFSTSEPLQEVKVFSDNVWNLHVDGSSNARRTGIDIVLASSRGFIIERPIRLIFKASNNETKYEALLAGLDIAYSVGIRHVRVFYDSQLVVNQINGDFVV